MKRVPTTALAVLLPCLLAGCGGEASTPTAPTTPPERIEVGSYTLTAMGPNHVLPYQPIDPANGTPFSVTYTRGQMLVDANGTYRIELDLLMTMAVGSRVNTGLWSRRPDGTTYLQEISVYGSDPTVCRFTTAGASCLMYNQALYEMTFRRN